MEIRLVLLSINNVKGITIETICNQCLQPKYNILLAMQILMLIFYVTIAINGIISVDTSLEVGISTSIAYTLYIIQ